MTITAFLRGFAEAQMRLSEMTEREVHHRDDDGPVGDGWVRIATDPSGYSTWERTRFVKAASEWKP